MSSFTPDAIPGASPAHTYALYDQAAGVVIANGAQGALEWALNTAQTGYTALLSLTSAASPTILTAGTYVFSTLVTVDDLTAGGGFQAFLVANLGGVDTVQLANSSAPNATLFPAASVTLAIYLPAATVVQVLVTNADGVSARTFTHGTFVQRVG